ncbi:MAG: leucine-rich repeat protein, partial [Eubacteriales bacterium]
MKTNKARKTVFTSISVLALVLMTVVFGISLHAQTIIIGDMNNDSVVNEDDAAYLLRHVLLPSKYPIDQSGDLNGDGKVDVDDALYLSKHITSPDEYPLTCHHDFGEWTQTKAPTCTEKGEEKRTCNNCGSSETRDVAALGHEYVDGVCKNCGQEIQPSEGLEYTLNSDDESYYVSGIGSCKDTDIVIPSTYNGMPVTGIGSNAFENCSSLTSIEIPDSVTSIGGEAFEYCSSLTSIKIPDSVTSIGYGAFAGTAYYNNNDNWVDGVLYIGNHLIEAKSYTLSANYTIKSGTKCIADGAFSGCDSLTSITIPDSVTSIGYDAFRYCSSLTSIKIPDSVTSIGWYAFYDTAYYNNNDNWIDGVLYIGNHLIKAKPDTLPADYTIKSGTKCIADDAFSHCSSLTSITIPNSVTSIGDQAFEYCSSLTSVTIGNSVTSIGN